MSKVRIIIGSKSDLEICQPIRKVLDDFGVMYDFQISSAHRSPEKTVKLAQDAEAEGYAVIIACAGMAAHLPGVIASHTSLPVIGVPIQSGALGGKDALYSIVQMPPGVPVATVAINGVKNAALLAIQILATADETLRDKFKEYKQSLKG
ncbi:MAG: 5-(carboxyamino)imidazole ribonucleotide mutase [Candidatus Cloacimonetes bacterium]|jgi:5-(carboxyamino)imidazole ribonucleotide mutase|nr:5-(carboxyamino)imidazole ribonucleotide mutase [Candidatus Cloacimonadota bacterium]MDD2423579.1 5-(carboxyamino)imidazole ribonucleotide mutase [Candidatus Cloacimonadota bacterium]MDD3562173.1 5-(carboxyamino)imidazole ribonucleotide mutase [Candidatus Cloacimonadota bacterium]MDD4277105.1 5-(carboxyamino)imidazole ribonucleotide mutase [Candidatus Cloacimonadota bacterium]MDY0325997.1 5-(carboxyamino)imidazole ribonucleotide mutase [Candidatus Cloacimonadaceae bacterium]